jgi:hypothetical protein
MNPTLSPTNDTLEAFGYELRRATRRELRRGRRRRVRRGAAVVALTAATVTAAAGAAGLFSGDDVATGLPAGSAIFGDTHPRCDDAQADGTYRCTLASPPTQERLDNYTGSKQLLAVRGVIAGGCVGRDGAGLHWDCYVGEKAVAHGILVHDLLGQKLNSPSRG